MRIFALVRIGFLERFLEHPQPRFGNHKVVFFASRVYPECSLLQLLGRFGHLQASANRAVTQSTMESLHNRVRTLTVEMLLERTGGSLTGACS